MTTIDELTKAPLLTDDDLFVIWLSGSGRTRSISGKTLRDNLLAKGFNPDAFVSGRIDDVADKLYMTNQYGLEVEIGTVISLLSNHNIEELKNIPPLEANKLFKVNSNGSGVEYYDLNTLRIEDLSNIPSIKALGYLRGSKDGSYAEWIASSGTKIGIQEKGVNKGDANTLNANKNLLISLNNDIATIDLDSQITADIAYNASDIKTANQEIEKNKEAIKANKLLSETNETYIKEIKSNSALLTQSNGTVVVNATGSSVSVDRNIDVSGDVNANNIKAIDKLANDNKNAIANIDHTKIYKDNTTLEIKSKGGVRLNEQDGTNRARLELASNQKDDQVSIESNSTKGSLLFSSVKSLEWTASTVSVNLPILVQGKKVATEEIIVNVSDDAVLKSQGNDVVKVSFNGIEISGSGATNIVGISNIKNPINDNNIINDNNDILQIQQCDLEGKFQKNWITGTIDGCVSIYDNGNLTLQTNTTGGDGYRRLDLINSYRKVFIENKNTATGDIATIGWFLGKNWQYSIVFSDKGGGRLNGTWTGTVTPPGFTLKDKIIPLDGLNKINLLKPIEWTCKEENTPTNDDGGHSIHSVEINTPKTNKGFTAQSFQKLFPQQVEEIQPEDLPDYVVSDAPILGIKKDITGMEMDALIVASIQQLSKKNDALESRLSALEAANSAG